MLILYCIENEFCLDKYNHNTLTVPCERSKIIPALSKFPVKLICCIAFGSPSRACGLLTSIDINLKFSLNYG